MNQPVNYIIQFGVESNIARYRKWKSTHAAFCVIGFILENGHRLLKSEVK